MAYERLLRDCFWEYDFSAEDIGRIVESGSFKEKLFLFEKILANSTDLLLDLQIFDKEELRRLLDSYSVPSFNHDYLKRRKNIVEYFFFDEPLDIEELKWIA